MEFPNIVDIEEVFDETDEEDDEDMGVIELPGGPNDELDIEYMLRVLQDDVHMSLTNEGKHWWNTVLWDNASR